MATFSIKGSDGLAGGRELRALQARLASLEALVARLEAVGAAARALAADTPEGPLARRIVASDLPAIATATALPAARVGAFRVRVLRLARQHHIVSDAVPASRGVIAAGRYVFAVGAGERATTIELGVGEDDPDGDVLEAISHAIAAAGIGAHAWVEYGHDERGDVARLHVLSRSYGTHAALFTADLSRNLMVLIGLAASGEATTHNGGTVEAAADAEYEIDRVPARAPGNRIYLPDRRVCLALHGAREDATALLAIRPDVPHMARRVRDWLEILAEARAAAEADPALRAALPGGGFGAGLAQLAAEFRDAGLDPGAPPPAVADLEAALAAVDPAFIHIVARRTAQLAGQGISAAGQIAAALARQAEWYRTAPNPAAARRMVRAAIKAYFPA